MSNEINDTPYYYTVQNTYNRTISKGGLIIDWRNYCTPIRDQGSCGSCTAFGSLGAIEANINKLDNILKDLSEEDIFFCSGGTCNDGNTVEAVLDLCKDWIPTEQCCPYIDKDCYTSLIHRCKDWRSDGAKIDYYTPLSGANLMKIALNAGPIVGVMDVHESFMHYVSGVYHSLGASDPVVGGHCIAIVGYDDTLSAWIIRNSWGTGWGMNGYCYLKYGDSNIEETAYVVTPNILVTEPKAKSKCFGLGLLHLVYNRLTGGVFNANRKI